MPNQPSNPDPLQAPVIPAPGEPETPHTPDPGQGDGSREQEAEDLEDTSTETDKTNDADQAVSEKPSATALLEADGQAAVAGLPLGN